MKRKAWTKEEERMLQDNRFLDADILAKILKRTKKAVIAKLAAMKPIDSSKDKTLIPLPETFTQTQKEERIYILAHQLKVKIL